MEAASVSVTSVSSAQLSANQLPTFVTQPNTSHTSKQVPALPTASGNQQNSGMQHVTSTSAPIMVIQQPDVTSAVGLVAASAPSTQGMAGATVQTAAEQPQMSGLYTSATGLPAEYVIPGTNMLSQAAQPFQVHVPVMQQQEGGNEESSGYHEMDEDGRGGDKDELREQDRFLPIANVARIMKKGVPKQGKIAKDAKECVQECVSEFISFITSEASERCQQEKRKTINGEDILFAMSTLGFDNYVDPLKQYLTKYREAMKGEKGAMNTSTDTVRSEVDQSIDESSESSSQAMSFQVPVTAIHPSMVTGEQPTSTIYTYPAQLQSQALHFQ